MNIKVIIGSTRKKRFAELPAKWIFEELKKHRGVNAELLDLRDYPLPFYEEENTPTHYKDSYPSPAVEKWGRKIKEADGFIIVTPEYNHGYPAVLKNALDYVYYDWNNKAVGFVSYGSVLGARAIEQLRQVAVELHMASVRDSVHLPGPWLVMDETGNVKPGTFESHEKAAEKMITQLLWWAQALKNAREKK